VLILFQHEGEIVEDARVTAVNRGMFDVKNHNLPEMNVQGFQKRE
jgi:hypothetical protein